MKCFVYRNLHKPGYTYSIKALEGPYKGRVVAYGSMITVLNAVLQVKEKGRQRVLSSGAKNVHAGVVGDLLSVYDLETRLPNDINRSLSWFPFRGTEITYNPWKYASFVEKKTAKPIRQAECVQFNGGLIEAFGVTV